MRVAPLVLAALLGCAGPPAPPAAEGLPAPPVPPGHVRVAGLVLPWVRGDVAANLRRLEPLVRAAAAAGADVVVTTECALDGYAATDPALDEAAYRALAQELPGGAAVARLAALADELDVVLVLGLVERARDVCHNALVVLDADGALRGVYRKRELLWEAARNAPGAGPLVVPTEHGALGLLICADRRRADFARELAELGASLVLCPSGGVFGPRRNDGLVLRRARESGLPIVFVHPNEFLVALPDGLAARALVGTEHWVADERRERGRVYYHDLPR